MIRTLLFEPVPLLARAIKESTVPRRCVQEGSCGRAFQVLYLWLKIKTRSLVNNVKLCDRQGPHVTPSVWRLT